MNANNVKQFLKSPNRLQTQAQTHTSPNLKQPPNKDINSTYTNLYNLLNTSKTTSSLSSLSPSSSLSTSQPIQQPRQRGLNSSTNISLNQSHDISSNTTDKTNSTITTNATNTSSMDSSITIPTRNMTRYPHSSPRSISTQSQKPKPRQSLSSSLQAQYSSFVQHTTTLYENNIPYELQMSCKDNILSLSVEDITTSHRWIATFTSSQVEDITYKTGTSRKFDIIIKMLQKSILQTSNLVSLSLLSPDDINQLENILQKRCLISNNENETEKDEGMSFLYHNNNNTDHDSHDGDFTNNPDSLISILKQQARLKEQRSIRSSGSNGILNEIRQTSVSSSDIDTSTLDAGRSDNISAILANVNNSTPSISFTTHTAQTHTTHIIPATLPPRNQLDQRKYIILTYLSEFDSVHFPFTLQYESNPDLSYLYHKITTYRSLYLESTSKISQIPQLQHTIDTLEEKMSMNNEKSSQEIERLHQIIQNQTSIILLLQNDLQVAKQQQLQSIISHTSFNALEESNIYQPSDKIDNNRNHDHNHNHNSIPNINTHNISTHSINTTLNNLNNTIDSYKRGKIDDTVDVTNLDTDTVDTMTTHVDPSSTMTLKTQLEQYRIENIALQQLLKSISIKTKQSLATKFTKLQTQRKHDRELSRKYTSKEEVEVVNGEKKELGEIGEAGEGERQRRKQQPSLLRRYTPSTIDKLQPYFDNLSYISLFSKDIQKDNTNNNSNNSNNSNKDKHDENDIEIENITNTSNESSVNGNEILTNKTMLQIESTRKSYEQANDIVTSLLINVQDLFPSEKEVQKIVKIGKQKSSQRESQKGESQKGSQKEKGTTADVLSISIDIDTIFRFHSYILDIRTTLKTINAIYIQLFVSISQLVDILLLSFHENRDFEFRFWAITDAIEKLQSLHIH